MLPSDRYLAELLGLSDEQYEFWREEVRLRAARGPQPAVVCGIDPVTLAIIQVVIAVGLSLLASALMPRPQQRGRPAELKASNQTGESQNSLQAYAPRVGFDSTQDVAAIGEPIPVVYAHRETINGITYGGVRVNTTLLWSQIVSLGGSQMLRAMFMLAEGRVASIDTNGFAIGDNSISIYDLGSDQANQIGSRITIYHRPNGGRIVASDRVYGRSAATDPGNAMRAGVGAADVFQVPSINNVFAADFCSAHKPSTGTTFGVYTLIGNDLGYKLNPSVRPGVIAQLVPEGDQGDGRVVCDRENTTTVERAKNAAFFSTRSGITAGSFTAVNDEVTYRLLKSGDYGTNFIATINDNNWTASRTVFRIDDFAPRNIVLDAMSVSVAAVDTTAKTVTVSATLMVATVVNVYEELFAGNDYFWEYTISVSNAARGITLQTTLRVDIEVTGTIPNTNVDVSIAGADVLTSPDRLRSTIVFTYTETEAYSENGSDAAASIANRQNVWDDAIVVGDLYKIGSALAVCTSRSPANEIFRSETDLGNPESGQSIEARFRIVRPGAAFLPVTTEILETSGLTYVQRKTATSGPHLMRIAIASGATTRECRLVEIGFRSTLGIRYNGILQFRTTLTYADTDGRACLNKQGQVIGRGNTVKVDNFQSGQMTGSEERYSFFRLRYKKQSETTLIQLDQILGFVGIEQQSMFNALRLEFPSQDSWEWELEPLSGWEIRNATATTLYVIDSRLSNVITLPTTTGGRTIKAIFNGRSVLRTQETFRLLQTERENIGTIANPLPHPDTNNNYADAWGKLAEAFIYDEIQSSATQPEHEIVYVNEIVQNPTVPLYDGIAMFGVNALSAYEWQQFSQLSGYVTGGTEVRRLLNDLTEGSSHLLPDLALDRLTNAKYGPKNIGDDLIGLNSFRLSAQWCYDRQYFFDGGVIISQENPRQWIADHAGFMLLDFREVNGRYELVPFITFGTVEHKALFSAGNIAEGTFQFETIPLEDRQPSQISVKWRQERSSTNPANPGMFPQEREVLVREAAPYGSDDLPIESIDLSNFCTNENHAIDVAKFTLRLRRLRDHAIKFETTYDGLEGISAGVGPGDMIRVAMDATVYDQFNNGIVLADGTVVSTTPLSDGSYNVISWNGTGTVNDNGTLTISGGKASPAGIVFTVKQTTTQVRSYQIAKIAPTDDGAYQIEAVHMPTDASLRMVAAADWDRADAWVIRR
jgi:hypothetical protein